MTELRAFVGDGRRQSRRSCCQLVGNTQSQSVGLRVYFFVFDIMWWTCAAVHRQLEAEEGEGGVAVHLHECTVVAAAGESREQQD